MYVQFQDFQFKNLDPQETKSFGVVQEKLGLGHFVRLDLSWVLLLTDFPYFCPGNEEREREGRHSSLTHALFPRECCVAFVSHLGPATKETFQIPYFDHGRYESMLK